MLQIIIDFIWGILSIGAAVFFFIDGEYGQGIIALVAGVALSYYFGYRKWKKRKGEKTSSDKTSAGKGKFPKIALKKPQFLASKKEKKKAPSEGKEVKKKTKGTGIGVLKGKLKSSKKIVLVVAGLLLIIALVGIVPSIIKKVANKPIATYDDYPVFLLRDGDVSVYREMNVYKDYIEKHIIVTNLSDERQEDLKIYEAIPGEIASTASNLTFSEQPYIVEDAPPVVRWDIDTLYASGDSKEFSWKIGGTVGDAKSVLGKSSSEPILEAFGTHWPSLILKDPAETWKEFYEFSKSEMEKSSKAASTGKTIMVAKDVVDVMAIVATGTGALDALNLMSELHSIGTTIYDAETPEAIADANQWLMITGLVQNGYENRKLLKTAMQQGVSVLKASQGAKAAQTTAKLAKTANAMDGVADGVSAAESAGLNIAGLIVDYAVINDVAQTAKYSVFEMNEQTKMAYLAKAIYKLWEKYEDGDLTEGEAKTLMELETLFFIVQQNELKVRMEYFESQTGILDTTFSWLPVVGNNSAKQGLVDARELLEAGQNQISWRRNSIRKVYSGAKAISDREELRRLEEEALEESEDQHAEDEEISEIVKAGTSEFRKIQRRSRNVIRDLVSSEAKDRKKSGVSYYLTTGEVTPTSKPSKPTAKPTRRSTPMPTKKPSSSSASGSIDFSIGNFPSSLLSLAKGNTSTSPGSDSCYQESGFKDYMYAEYGSGSTIVSAGVGKFDGSTAAGNFVSNYVDCMNSLVGQSAFKSGSKSTVGNYPFQVVEIDLDTGTAIAGTAGTVGKYVITIVILTPSGDGGSLSDHKEAMADIIQAFLSGGSVAVTSTPAPSTSSGCTSVDLSTGYDSYYYYKDDQPCTSYTRNATSSKFNVKCNQPVARWRESYIRPYSLSSSGSVKIKAKVQLIDHSRFFTESGGIGVKYDDYVNLLVYSSDPRSFLKNECNKASSQTDWPKCALRNDDSGVLGHCGVPKYTESATCNFTVNAPSSQIYFGFGVSDAWPNEVEGILSNLQVCYE